MDLKKLHIQSKFLVTKDELTVDADELKEVAGSTTEDIQKVIEADKDIISQIRVEQDEENALTLIFFPRNIKPLFVYATINNHSHLLYFNYEDEFVLNEVGEELQINDDNVYVYSDDKLIVIVINGNVDVDISYVEYILKNNSYISMNTYYLYHPVTSAGTKLYKHSIAYSGNVLTIISTFSTYSSWNELLNNFYSVINATFKTSSDSFAGQVLQILEDAPNLEVIYYSQDIEGVYSYSISGITDEEISDVDTVTEL